MRTTSTQNIIVTDGMNLQFIEDTDAPHVGGGQFIDRTMHINGGKYVIRFYGAHSVKDFATRVLNSVRRWVEQGGSDGLYGLKPDLLPYRWAVVAAPAEVAAQIHQERM